MERNASGGGGVIIIIFFFLVNNLFAKKCSFRDTKNCLPVSSMFFAWKNGNIFENFKIFYFSFLQQNGLGFFFILEWCFYFETNLTLKIIKE